MLLLILIVEIGTFLMFYRLQSLCYKSGAKTFNNDLHSL